MRYVGMKRSAGDAALSAYGEIYGRVERKLFADVAAGKTATSLKSDYLKWYGIPARMFNAVRGRRCRRRGADPAAADTGLPGRIGVPG